MSTTGEHIEIRTADGVAEAYVARPDGSQDVPGVLLYMDAIGLRPQLERIADRIASWGYIVLVPNVFYRHGRAADLGPKVDLREPGARQKFFPTVAPLIAGHTPEEAARDLEAYSSTLLGLPGVARAPFGVTGYCMGGRLALRAAAQMPDQVAAVGMFHTGGLVTDAPDSPHLCVPHVRAEVLAGHADKDDSMPPSAIKALDAEFARAGVKATTAVYEGALHGYCMEDTSMYHEQATERHYTELADLFARTLR
ncbi:dienelactone hydrolase family protein [Nocardiopsis sp. ATB16-24]|uniref:dienelactone hydrolase family protein n=1 Tax=Nocardiopsis sp. ATB16-24 TaxID=3019555 RepID=UPI0025532D6F|nr:dienelactone hydrolase family protein [Nocardiopsis sp. ATB16-24]